MSNSKKSRGLIDELNELKAKLFDKEKKFKELENYLANMEFKLDEARRKNEELEKKITHQERAVVIREWFTKIWGVLCVLCLNLKAALIDLKILIIAAVLIFIGLDLVTYSGNGAFGIFWNSVDFQTINLLSFGPFGLLLLGLLAIYKWVVNNSRWQPQPSTWTWGKWIAVGFVALLAAVTIIVVVAIFRLDAIIALLRWLRANPS